MRPAGWAARATTRSRCGRGLRLVKDSGEVSVTFRIAHSSSRSTSQPSLPAGPSAGPGGSSDTERTRRIPDRAAPDFLSQQFGRELPDRGAADDPVPARVGHQVLLGKGTGQFAGNLQGTSSAVPFEPVGVGQQQDRGRKDEQPTGHGERALHGCRGPQLRGKVEGGATIVPVLADEVDRRHPRLRDGEGVPGKPGTALHGGTLRDRGRMRSARGLCSDIESPWPSTGGAVPGAPARQAGDSRGRTQPV